jgi:hypothetical protein
MWIPFGSLGGSESVETIQRNWYNKPLRHPPSEIRGRQLDSYPVKPPCKSCGVGNFRNQIASQLILSFHKQNSQGFFCYPPNFRRISVTCEQWQKVALWLRLSPRW